MTDLMFLTHAEVSDLTGCKQPAAQKRWLAKNGLKFFIRRDGRPSVPADQVFTERHSGPNLDALENLR